jgi:8-oxo-dGTP pyrophosphatase MutT (NUDIX family)
LCLDWSDEPRATLPEIERLIAVEWERRTAQAKETGQILFNGGLARYVGHQVGDGCLQITVGPTDYRDFVGTNLYNNRRVEEFGWRRFANPVGTTALIVSADGYIVLGRRSERVAYHGGYLHTIGGALEARDCADPEHIDAFAAVLRELSEEVKITDAEVTSIECIGLARDTEILQPELLFEVRVSVPADDLCVRLDRTDPQQEHVGLEYCPDRPEAVVDFLHDSAPFAPVAAAAMMLRGSLTWGDEWYGAATAEL